MSRLALFLAVVLLSGCASVARQPPPVVAEGDVQLSGRLSVTVAGAAGKATGGAAGFQLSGNPAAGQKATVNATAYNGAGTILLAVDRASVAIAPVVVPNPGTDGPAALATTGRDLVPWSGATMVLLCGGILLALFGRRRTRSE